MKALDYLFVNLYYYYSGDYYKLKWSTPQGWTTYVLAMGALIWSLVAQSVLDRFLLHYKSPAVFCLIIPAILYAFSYARYLRFDNYENILVQNNYIKKDGVVSKVISFMVILGIPLITTIFFIAFHKEMTNYGN